MHTPHTSKGFTLIELLTVIAIIGILAAIIVPVVGSVRKKARDVQCVSNLRGIGAAFYAYANDNRGLLPLLNYHDVAGGGQTSDFSRIWSGENGVRPYLVKKGWTEQQKILNCPSVLQAQGLDRGSSVTYSLNAALGDVQNIGSKGPLTGANPATFRAPAVSTMLMCHSAGWITLIRQHIVDRGPGPGYGPTTATQTTLFSENHNGKANILFADCHVAAKSFTEINDPRYWSR